MFDQKLFDPTPRHSRIHGFFERISTAVDTAAALCFGLGSLLFFAEATRTEATWLFLLGSIFFLAWPGARFAREFHLARLPVPEDTHDDD